MSKTPDQGQLSNKIYIKGIHTKQVSSIGHLRRPDWLGEGGALVILLIALSFVWTWRENGKRGQGEEEDLIWGVFLEGEGQGNLYQGCGRKDFGV